MSARPSIRPSLPEDRAAELRRRPWTALEVSLLLERLDGAGWRLLARHGTVHCADFREGRWRVQLGGLVVDAARVRERYFPPDGPAAEEDRCMRRFLSDAALLASSTAPLGEGRLRRLGRHLDVVAISAGTTSGAGSLGRAVLHLVKRGFLRPFRSPRDGSCWEITESGRCRVDSCLLPEWREWT